MKRRRIIEIEFVKKYEVGRLPGAPWQFVKWPIDSYHFDHILLLGYWADTGVEL